MAFAISNGNLPEEVTVVDMKAAFQENAEIEPALRQLVESSVFTKAGIPLLQIMSPYCAVHATVGAF